MDENKPGNKSNKTTEVERILKRLRKNNELSMIFYLGLCGCILEQSRIVILTSAKKSNISNDFKELRQYGFLKQINAGRMDGYPYKYKIDFKGEGFQNLVFLKIKKRDFRGELNFREIRHELQINIKRLFQHDSFGLMIENLYKPCKITDRRRLMDYYNDITMLYPLLWNPMLVWDRKRVKEHGDIGLLPSRIYNNYNKKIGYPKNDIGLFKKMLCEMNKNEFIDHFEDQIEFLTENIFPNSAKMFKVRNDRLKKISVKMAEDMQKVYNIIKSFTKMDDVISHRFYGGIIRRLDGS